MSTPKNVRLPLMVSDQELDAIDAWRYANKIPSRAEAIRRLIERGLKSDPMPAYPPTSGAIDLTRVRPYPADEIAVTPAQLIKSVNVRLPERLKLQLDWLADACQTSLREQVDSLLQRGVDQELAQLGIKPLGGRITGRQSANSQQQGPPGQGGT